MTSRKAKLLIVNITALHLCIMSLIAQGAGVVLGQTTWSTGNGHDYAIVEFPLETWNSASIDIATTLPGYHLATITSQAEQDFIWQFFLDTTSSGRDWWLGGFQPIEPEIDPAEGWEWVTGEIWDYTNWNSGEPNNANGIEDHLSFEGSIGGTWNDCCTLGEGVVLGGYIAERTFIPIPPALWLFGTGLLGLIGISKRKKAA